MRAALLLTLAAAAVAGCTPEAPPPASYYRPASQLAPVVVGFAARSDEPAPADAARLLALRETLPAWVQPELFASGPRTLARARAVRRLLGRPLVVRPAPPAPGGGTDPDVAVLVAPVQGIVPDACLGPGQPVLGDVWPGDDVRRARLLPPGCATELAVQAQVDAAGAGRDLLRGQPLLPGASSPFADVIERYYRRNEQGGRSWSDGSGGGGGSTVNRVSNDAAPQSAAARGAAANPANPLVGPLPAAPSGAATQ